MKNLTELHELVGKTIIYADDEYGLFIRFSDGDCLDIQSAYDETGVYFMDNSQEIPSFYNYERLFKRGIIDENAYNDIKQRKLKDDELRAKEDEEQRIDSEISTLKRLKDKYPNL